MKTAVVCADEDRRNFLAQVVRHHAPAGAIAATVEFRTVNDALNTVNTVKGRESLSFVVLSMVGGGVAESDVQVLTQEFRQSRIIVELDDDDVERAFEMLRLGAFNVVSYLITKTGMLWDIFTRAIVPDRRPYGPLVNVVARNAERGISPWGFMSMPFDASSPAHGDYFFAICPTMKRLGLELRRLDEMVYEGLPHLEEKARKAISACPVFVTFISYLTPTCLLEVEVALSEKKTIVLLWRPGVGDIPKILKGKLYVEYSTMTELAMKLFFGLGGSSADLDRAG